MKKIALVLCMLALCGNVFPALSYGYQAKPQNSQNKVASSKGNVVFVPAGQTFRGVFMAPVSSDTAYTGQEITLALGSDFYYNNKRIAPAGSTIIGTVIEVASAKYGSMNGKLTFRFTQIITPSGFNIPISAIVKTADGTGAMIGGSESTKDSVGGLSIGTETGAIIGTITSPLSGGNALKGTALRGAGSALTKSIWNKGVEIVIPTNASVDLVLTQPITVNPAMDENQ